MSIGWGVGQIRMGVPFTNALYLPGGGAPVNRVTTPDTPANSITDDIDMRIWVAPTDWTPPASTTLMTKSHTSGTTNWQWSIVSDGRLMFMFVTTSGLPVWSTVATGFADGSDHWLRFTRRRVDGLGRFFVSGDGTAWTQLGTDQFTVPGTAMTGGAGLITIGAHADGGLSFAGIVRYAELRDGIDGTVVNSFDPAAVTRIGTRDPSTVAAGGPWTVIGNGWDWVAA